jgi:purine catabolism regulator
VALAITRRLAVSEVEAKFCGDFLHDVITGDAGSPEQVIEHCTQLGWDVNRPLVAVVAGLDDAPTPSDAPRVAGLSPQERLTAAWQQVVRSWDRAAPVVGFGDEVVALIPASTQNAVTLVASLVAAVTGDGGGGRRSFSTGVSRVTGSVADLATGYEQARKARRVGRWVHGPGAVAHFDALGVHRLLSLVGEAGELRAFATDVLGSLSSDTAQAADLRNTLQTLLDTNCNAAEAARILHFHYNTLRHRIGKLEAIVGPFVSDPLLRLNVALALQVLQMRGFS